MSEVSEVRERERVRRESEGERASEVGEGERAGKRQRAGGRAAWAGLLAGWPACVLPDAYRTLPCRRRESVTAW